LAQIKPTLIQVQIVPKREFISMR